MPFGSKSLSSRPHLADSNHPKHPPRQFPSLPIDDTPFVEGYSHSSLHRPHDAFFTNAHNFVLKDATFTETHVHQIGKAVFQFLEPYTLLDATTDSSARDPAPKCYPHTRLKIRRILDDWVDDYQRGWKMLWVRGFAGTGKSAVAQSFASSCDARGILGGSYFFCRTAGRNRFETVVPTLVYQLAIKIPQYRSLIASELADNPLLLRNSPHLQFKKLIIEPFTILHRQHPRKPIVIVLDGLDECDREEAQLTILALINDALHASPDLPILWLICSRPEQHFKHAFFTFKHCGRLELVIDEESHKDVELYVRTRITRIQGIFKEFTPSDWPSENKLKELLDKISGLFVLAATCLDFVGDTNTCDPVGQLDYLLEFLRLTRRVDSRNPLMILDLLYSNILRNIPDNMLSTTLRILSFFIFLPAHMPSLTQVLCNFLLLNRYAFYRAVRWLHSVMGIPDHQNAMESNLTFHHTSFQDFLLDSIRSGEFAVGQPKDRLEFAKSVLYWYELDTSHFHTNDGLDFDENHDHDSLPGLTCVSPDNDKLISFRIAEFVDNCWDIIAELPWRIVDEELLSRIYNFDFGCCNARNVHSIANWFTQNDASSNFVRTEPSGPSDFQLLEYFHLVIKNGVARPAVFPLKWAPNEVRSSWAREYFIIGRDSKSAIVWLTSRPRSAIARFSSSAKYTIHLLGGGKEPSEVQISDYHGSLRKMGWNEDDAVRFTKTSPDSFEQTHFVQSTSSTLPRLCREPSPDAPPGHVPIHPAATESPLKDAIAAATIEVAKVSMVGGVAGSDTTSTAHETKSTTNIEAILTEEPPRISGKHPTVSSAESTSIDSKAREYPMDKAENVEGSRSNSPGHATVTSSPSVPGDSTKGAMPAEVVLRDIDLSMYEDDTPSTVPPDIGLDDPTPSTYDSARAGEVKENGNEAFKAGKYQEAIDLYTEAIHLDPTEPLYLTNRAAAYMGLKRFRPALEDCQQAATLQQASPQPKTLLRLARCQLMLGLLVAAASTAKEILTIDAYNPQALELQEKIRTLKTQVKNSKNAKSRKEWDLAKSTLDECFRAIKGEVPTEWRLWEVEIALARRDWEKADTAVNEALRINLNSPDVLALRGLVLFLSGKMGPAKKHVTHALRLDPSCEPAMKLRKRVMDVERLEEEGNAAFRSRQLLEALEKYSRALERIGKAEEEGGGGHIRATLLSTRAAAFFELAHFGEALNDATSALELSPKSVQLLRARARIYLHLQRFDSCVADFKSAVKQAEGQGTDAEIQGLRLELMKAVAAWNRSRGKNYYDTLGVEMDSNESDIKAAYDREAWRCHPNRGGDIKRYRQVVEAYEVISDPQRRVRYDMGEIEGGVNDDGSFVVRVVVEG